MESKIEQLIGQMTVAEKVSLLAGASMWTTVPVPRLGIPAIKVSDGPNGARGGGSFAGGITSACFPVGIALAATWNTALIEQVGGALGEEAKSKGAHMLLAPTVNIHRSPLSGRNFECYSEDPYLSARIAVAYINGVQSRNVGATVKHFVCNDSEFERNTISSEVGDRALREIYLPPFEAAVKEAKTWGVMSSYNKLNGTFCSENPDILIDLLKEEWGFDGIVMSDWFGTKSTAASVLGGQDLEMPGPAQWRGDRLLAAVQKGEVDQATLDERVRRMLRIIQRAGAFEQPDIPPEQAIDRPEHRAIARQAAVEGIVLLKNTGDILPLDAKALESVAIIGPNARTAQIMGGGSSQVNAHYVVSPYEGITARVGDRMTIGYEIGCTNHKSLPRLDVRLLTPAADAVDPGLTAHFYNSLDLSGDVALETVVHGSELSWLGEVAPGIDFNNFSARLTGCFTAQETGAYTFGLTSAGLSRLSIDGQEVIDNWTAQERGESFFGTGSTEVSATVEMQAGQAYDLEIAYSREGASMLSAVRLGLLEPVAADSIARATALAARSDVAVVFVGLNGEWESEGHDRPDMELVGQQAALVEAVAAANPRTVVVLQSGSPVAMPWLNEVAGVLQAWFPGQECGNAIADVLFGAANPSGRLPQTFPLRLEDNPAYLNYPGENGRVYYGEGIFVGYRYYEKKKIGPLFPFGYGLSYTTFRYDNLRLGADTIGPEDTLEVLVDVSNTGARAGQEVVQLYVRDVVSSLARPEKELKAFAKVALDPGETQTVILRLDRTALACYDDGQGAWVAEAGDFEVLVGSSSADIRASAGFTLAESVAFGGPPQKGLQLSINNSVGELLANAESAAILEKHLPGLAEQPQLGMAMGFALVQVAGFAKDRFPPAALDAIAADLAKLAPIDPATLSPPPQLSLWQRLLMKVIGLFARRSS